MALDLFDSMFDFNDDGKLDNLEKALVLEDYIRRTKEHEKSRKTTDDDESEDNIFCYDDENEKYRDENDIFGFNDDNEYIDWNSDFSENSFDDFESDV